MPSRLVRPFVPEDYVALATPQEPPGVAQRLGVDLAMGGPAFTGLLDGQPVGCAGVLLMAWPGVGRAWTVLGPRVRTEPLWLSRMVVRRLRTIIAEHRLIRVEADVLATDPIGRCWVEWMGFVEEGRMPRRGPGGADMLRYALFPEAAP